MNAFFRERKAGQSGKRVRAEGGPERFVVVQHAEEMRKGAFPHGFFGGLRAADAIWCRSVGEISGGASGTRFYDLPDYAAASLPISRPAW